MTSSMTACSSTFERVLSRFRHSLTVEEAEDFGFTKLEDVHRVIEELQEKQGRKRTMMDLSRIQSFLEAMEQYGKVIEVFLNTTNFLAFVWVGQCLHYLYSLSGPLLTSDLRLGSCQIAIAGK